jgi:hypothetical protein
MRETVAELEDLISQREELATDPFAHVAPEEFTLTGP